MVTVIQIALIDIVFSLDSVFVAVGLAKDLAIMVAAIIAAVLVMMWVAGPIGDFVDRHPTIKMLALAFLILIGATLVAEACTSKCRRSTSTSRWRSRRPWS